MDRFLHGDRSRGPGHRGRPGSLWGPRRQRTGGHSACKCQYPISHPGAGPREDGITHYHKALGHTEHGLWPLASSSRCPSGVGWVLCSWPLLGHRQHTHKGNKTPQGPRERVDGGTARTPGHGEPPQREAATGVGWGWGGRCLSGWRQGWLQTQGCAQEASPRRGEKCGPSELLGLCEL